MLDWSSCPAVERDPERLSGAWVFRGTRVPVSALFENLEDGGQSRSLSNGSRASPSNRCAQSSTTQRKVWICPRLPECAFSSIKHTSTPTHVPQPS
jgi:hypothetical protein